VGEILLSSFDRLNWLGAEPEVSKREINDTVHAVFMQPTLKGGHFSRKLPIRDEFRKANSKELRIGYDVTVHPGFRFLGEKGPMEVRFRIDVEHTRIASHD